MSDEFDPEGWAALYVAPAGRAWEELDVPGLEVYARCARCSPKLPPSRRCSSACPYEILRGRGIAERRAKHEKEALEREALAARETVRPNGWRRRLLRKVKRWL